MGGVWVEEVLVMVQSVFTGSLVNPSCLLPTRLNARGSCLLTALVCR